MSVIHEFDGKEWRTTTTTTTTTTTQQCLKLITFNVWFGSFEQTKRCDALCDIIATKLNADIVCLQEVTAMFIARIREHSGVRANYQIVVPDRMPSYGLVCLIRRGSSLLLLNVEHTFYPKSEMERSYLLLELMHVSFANRRLFVATTHLESLQQCAAQRVVQLQQLFQRLDSLIEEQNANDRRSIAFVMGDFNFDPSWPEEKSIPSLYTDCWLAAAVSDDDRERREMTGYTEDTYRNLMRFKAQGKHKQVRFDRMLCRSSSSSTSSSSSSSRSTSSSSTSFVVEECELIGTEAFEKEIWASDHFGLCAVVKNNNRSARKSSSSTKMHS